MEREVSITIDVNLEHGVSTNMSKGTTVLWALGDDDPTPEVIDQLIIEVVAKMRKAYNIPGY